MKPPLIIIRTDTGTKQVLTRAARARGKTLAEFILQSCFDAIARGRA